MPDPALIPAMRAELNAQRAGVLDPAVRAAYDRVIEAMDALVGVLGEGKKASFGQRKAKPAPEPTPRKPAGKTRIVTARKPGRG